MSTADILAFASLALAIGAIVYKAGKNAKDVDNLGTIARSNKAEQDRRYRRIVSYLQRHSTVDDRDEIAKLIREDRID